MDGQPIQKPGLFERMGLFQKVLIFLFVILVIIIAIGTYFGGFKNIYNLIFNVSIVAGIAVFLFILVKATGILLTPAAFSPRQDLKNNLIKMSKFYMPDNVNNLWFIGSDYKRRVLAGKIVGLMGLPYYSGEIERNEEGETEFTEDKDLDGKKIPKFKSIKVSYEEGDTLFMVRKGWFIFAKTRMIRANRKFHSELNGDVDIYDINPVPYGFFEYPYKQMQAAATQIMMQSQIETILSAHEHQHDLISQGVDSAVWYNPYMRMALKNQSELPQGVDQQQ